MHVAEELQQAVSRLLATRPVGVHLALIGGFRLRLLNDSCRLSRDLDYHTGADLATTSGQVLATLQQEFLPLAFRRWGFQGTASDQVAPDTYSPTLKQLQLRLWRGQEVVLLPIDLSCVPVSDPLTAVHVGGPIIQTVSDADLIELKITAIFSRLHLEPRDLLDLWLFRSFLRQEAWPTLERKIAAYGIDHKRIVQVFTRFVGKPAYHARLIRLEIESSVEDPIRQQLLTDVTPETILADCLTVLRRIIPGLSA